MPAGTPATICSVHHQDITIQRYGPGRLGQAFGRLTPRSKSLSAAHVAALRTGKGIEGRGSRNSQVVPRSALALGPGSRSIVSGTALSFFLSPTVEMTEAWVRRAVDEREAEVGRGARTGRAGDHVVRGDGKPLAPGVGQCYHTATRSG